MEKMKSEHPITEMADALEISASGYADHLHKDQLPRRMEDRRLQAELVPIFEQSRSTYGSPRLHDALRKKGYRCGKNRIQQAGPGAPPVRSACRSAHRGQRQTEPSALIVKQPAPAAAHIGFSSGIPAEAVRPGPGDQRDAGAAGKPARERVMEVVRNLNASRRTDAGGLGCRSHPRDIR